MIDMGRKRELTEDHLANKDYVQRIAGQLTKAQTMEHLVTRAQRVKAVVTVERVS